MAPTLSRRAFLVRSAAGVAALVVAPALVACSPSGRNATITSTPTTGPQSTGKYGTSLRAHGGMLVDASGHEIRLTGVNWFGLETETFAPHGLWTRNWRDMLDQIRSTGFNTIRLPFSNQLLEPASRAQSIDFTKNPDLQGLSGLEVMDRVIDGARERQLWVILDRHRPTAQSQSPLWYTDQVSEERWLSDWVSLAHRYRGNPAVIGADLHNEPHGPATWGDGNRATDWRLAAESAGNAILNEHPEWLIIVQGIERYENDGYWWGGNLEGAGSHPVHLSRPDRLVYSAHDYGPGVYGQPWFTAPDFPSNLPGIWQRHWGYLKSDNVAPVLMGEFGGRSVGQDAEGVWQRRLVSFLKEAGVSYTYWSWNPDSGDTGGLLEDDWQTINRAKLDLLSTYLWPRASST